VSFESDIDDYIDAILDIVGERLAFRNIHVWDISHSITPPLNDIQNYLESTFTYKELSVENRAGQTRWVDYLRGQIEAMEAIDA
jgi:hypothetical protein